MPFPCKKADVSAPAVPRVVMSSQEVLCDSTSVSDLQLKAKLSFSIFYSAPECFATSTAIGC